MRLARPLVYIWISELGQPLQSYFDCTANLQLLQRQTCVFDAYIGYPDHLFKVNEARVNPKIVATDGEIPRWFNNSFFFSARFDFRSKVDQLNNK